MLAVIFVAIFVLILAAMGGFIWFSLRKKKQSSPQAKKEAQLKGALINKDMQTSVLMEAITDGIIVTDTENKVSLINKSASAMTEWPVEEAMNISAMTVLPLLADEKTNAMVTNDNHPFCKVLTSKTAVTETVQLATRSGKHIYISLAISPIILPKGDQLIGTVAVFRDVTKEKGEEQARADFVSTASHEMRTPVAAIEGYLALAMNDKVSKIDAKARDFLEKAHSSTQHLGQLFQDLLTSAKAEDGRLTSHPVVVEMGEFLEKLVDDLRFSAEKKGLQMEYISSSVSTGSQVGTVLDARGHSIRPFYFSHVDPDRVREVITNVFDNAVKYTDKGKISIAITGNDDVVQISIADTGPGIPAADIPHLFQKFYRVDNSATRTIGGTGLGLFICKKIIELYNGTIWAESEVNKGSKFFINLPRLSGQRAQQLQAEEKSQALV